MLRLQLRRAMRRRGLTPYQLASRVNMPAGQIYNILKSSDNAPAERNARLSFNTLERLARGLELKHGELEELLEFDPPLAAKPKR